MDKIGTYRIVDVLRSGAQTLYRARAADGRMVAVKAVPVANLSAEMRERFTREAETCRSLDHPNLTRVFEMGESDGVLFQAMELLEGADLGHVMDSGRVFGWDEKLSIMEQVCDGLQFAHDRKMVHRDIKPANLFLETSGRVRVLDFGMVRVAESELTKAGSSLGTLNYMSPEQVRGERCTQASDVFSAGIVFFQLATGKHPFSARNRSLPQVVSAIVFEPAPALSGLCPNAPEGLEFILNKALEKDPAHRLQNAGDLKQALSLCRITMKLGGAPAAAPESGKARAMRAPEPVDADKTRVLSRPQPAADAEKTRVLQRPAPVPIASPARPAAPPQPVAALKPRAAAAASPQRYCPSCTKRNEMNAAACSQCGTPLGAATLSGAERPARQANQTALYAAVAVAILLAIALVAVVIFK
jgi:eukaryotic-like serine/threonine-protein kinase